jgi:hypothetical protein
VAGENGIWEGSELLLAKRDQWEIPHEDYQQSLLYQLCPAKQV